MIKSLQTLKPITDAPSLHAKCDKPSVVGFNFMGNYIIDLYNKYHSVSNDEDKLLFAKDICIHNSKFPFIEYWQNETDICLEGEIWKPIYLWRNHYEASSFGRIRCLFSYANAVEKLLDEPRIIKQHKNKEGYLSAGINRSKKDTYPYKVNILISTAFYQNVFDLPQTNHIDGIKTNNYSINLEWCSRSYNMKHAFACGLRPFYDNDNHHQRKITKENVLIIQQSFEDYNILANRYNVSIGTIRRIKMGETYRHLTNGKQIRIRATRLNENDIIDIYTSKEKTSLLCTKYNTTDYTIQRIRNGSSYSAITSKIK
jgi:NUMOD4 motif-containing protein